MVVQNCSAKMFLTKAYIVRENSDNEEEYDNNST